jgi:hypothetical protein
VLAKSQAELDRTIRAARFDRDNEAEARRTAEATIARVRQMADAWEQRLPAKILTATAAEALRTATERYALAQPRQQGAAVGMVAPMTWYEQRPPRIEAMHWTGDNLADIQAWAGESRVTVSDEDPTQLWVRMLPGEGMSLTSLGDYVCRNDGRAPRRFPSAAWDLR